jgi:dipeptidyl aminopeptidase/acylaminoacyl peptidase
MKALINGLTLALGLTWFGTADAVDIDRYVKKDKFADIKLSPKGDYYAATVPLEDRTVLAVIRRADNKVTGHFALSENTHVAGFHWVNDERLLISTSEKYGLRDQPALTGELFAINADGSKPEHLVGYRVRNDGGSTGSKIQAKKVGDVNAFLIDDLPAEDKVVLVAVSLNTTDPYTRAERLDVYSGRRVQVAQAPVRNASFITDNNGIVRFASGHGSDNVRKLYYRAGDGADWQLISDESATGIIEQPIGFSADNRTAYFQIQHKQGPDSIASFDVATLARNELLRDDDVDPAGFIYRNGTSIPVGAFFLDGRSRTEFFDAASPEAKLYRSLEQAFEGHAVAVTSQTADGRLALVRAMNDRNPGDFYLFDTVSKKADYMVSRADWLDPDAMANVRPVSLTARDGLKLHGYLTIPKGSDGRNLPTIVLPHGGPFGIRDVWGFDSEAQMLAEAGYAVLQVNFRGSPGYGRSFREAGARQWGLAMQDDLTDATRWLVKEGVADPERMCIYGASYGAYAALMGVTKETDLYRCAVGYIGVYDLPTLHTDGDIQETKSGRTYVTDWIGERSTLAAVSPNRLADRIKVPVMLAAGGEDKRAPIQHTELMEKALIKAGVPVETLYYPTEGHGFYKEEHRREYYTRLLAFFARHLGGRTATVGAGGGQQAGAK